MLTLRKSFEGRFQDMKNMLGLNGAFGYEIIRKKLVDLLKSDSFILYILKKYGEGLLSIRSQYGRQVKSLYNEYVSNGKLDSADIKYLREEIFPIYINQIIIKMVSEGDLFILGNPGTKLSGLNIRDFAFTFDKNLKTNEISKIQVINTLRDRLRDDVDDQCLAVLLLLDNQTEDEIRRLKTKWNNKVGFSSRTERLTSIALKLRSDDPVLTDEDLRVLKDISVHARQLFDNYKEYFAVVKTPNETYYFNVNKDSFVTKE